MPGTLVVIVGTGKCGANWTIDTQSYAVMGCGQ